jgi:hypothetical protein
MPNHVANRITFAAEKAEEVFAVVIRDGRFDFETLVPSPPNMYHGNLSSADEKDFPINWLEWSRQNWGTKWNAYQSSHGVENGVAFINFQTSWTAPYPVMAAFCNRFNIPFEHRYYDEGENHWGIDKWNMGEWSSDGGRIERREKLFKREQDRRELALLYWGAETLAEIEAERASDA